MLPPKGNDYISNIHLHGGYDPVKKHSVGNCVIGIAN